MGEKVYNHLSITGFIDEAARQAFRKAAAKGTIAFSFERLLPLPDSDSVELAVRWGHPIYEEEGAPESSNNSVKEFELAGELGLSYSFDSSNDPPDSGIRRLSRMYPNLLMKFHSENADPGYFFALYKNGERFFVFFDEDELIHTRAAEWPMIAALSPENWRDEALHAFLREAAEKLREDVDFDEEMEQRREELRGIMAERPSHAQEPNAKKSDDEDVPF